MSALDMNSLKPSHLACPPSLVFLVLGAVLLLGATVASADHSVSATSVGTTNFLAETREQLNLSVTLTTGGNDIADEIWVNVTSGTVTGTPGIFFPNGTRDTAWSITNIGAPTCVAGSTCWRFASPNQAGTWHIRLEYTSGNFDVDGTQAWRVAAAEADGTIATDEAHETSTTYNMPLKVVGVRSLVIFAPNGVRDNNASANQTLNIAGDIVNRGTAAASGLRYRVTGASGESVEVDIPTLAAENGEALVQANLTLGPSIATRTIKGEVVGNVVSRTLAMTVVRGAALNNSVSANTTLAPNAPNAVTSRTAPETDPTNFVQALNTSTTVAFRMLNHGQSNATGVTVTALLFDSNGANQTDRFTVSTANVGTIPFGANATGTVSIAPVPCSNQACSNAPPDSVYNVTWLVNFWDENHNTSQPPTTHHLGNSTGLFRVDNTKAGITELAPVPPGTLQFQRGGANRVTFNVNITDPSLDDASVRLVILDDQLKRGISSDVNTCVTPPQFTEDWNQPAGFRCVLKDVRMNRTQGGDWTVSHDFAEHEDRLNNTVPEPLFRAIVIARDRAGNQRNFTFSQTIALQDTQTPAVSALQGPSTATIGSLVTIRAAVKDEHLLNTSHIRVFHVESNTDVSIAGNTGALNEATASGVAMTCPTCGTSRNGTYEGSFRPLLAGTYQIRVRATDLLGRAGESANPATITMTVTSGVSMRITEPGGEVFGKNLTASAGVSQLNVGTIQNISLKNEANIAQTFEFECRVLAETNVTGLQACNVSFGGLGGNGRPRQELSLPNAVNVSMFFQGNGTFIDNQTGIALGARVSSPLLQASLTAPPSARPGQIVRLELVAKPKFSAERASVVLGYEVAEARGVSVHFADASAKPVLNPVLQDQPDSVVRIIKPTRATEYTFRLNNTGNIEQTFHVKAVNVPNGWTFDFASNDNRWNDFAESIILAPAGAAGGLNSTVLRAVVTAPITATEGMPDQNITLRGNTSNAAGGAISQDARLQLTVRAPTITIGSWGGANVESLGGNGTTVNDGNATATPPRAGQNCSGDTAHPRAGNSSLPKTVCTYVSGGWTAFNFTVSVSSALNVNPADARITPTLIVTGPCGLSCPGGPGATIPAGIFTVPMTAVGGQFQGQNGQYFGAINLTDAVGNFSVRVHATDATDPFGTTGDTLESANVTLSIPERHTLSGTGELVAPTQCCVQVREGTSAATPLVPDNFGRYRANFGAPIFVRATADDSFGLGGNLSTMDLNVTFGGAVVDVLPMVRTAQTLIAGSPTRVGNATFEASFRPRGSFSESGGTYTFQVVARDAMGNLATSSSLADRFITIDLVDQNGPVVVPRLVGPGGLAGAPLDVEVGVGPINITATITDNSDAVGVPGGAINDTETRRPFALLRLGAVTKNYTLTRVGGGLDRWTFTIPAADINATGNYSVEVSAWDRANNLGRNSTTLQVLVNLPPVITPPAVTDIGAGGTVVVTIADANFDPAPAGALVVEVATGTGNFTAVTPTATKAGTVTTVSIPIATDGNLTVRVKATDTLGLSATREFNVRVDAAKPVATVSVVPTEIAAGRAFRPGSESFFVAPATKLQVTATDVGSGVATAAVTIRSSSGATRTLNLTTPATQFTLQELLGTAGLLDGEYTLTARVADRVGNVETSPEISIRLDSGAPVFTETLRPTTPLSVSVRDQRSGLARVEVEWRSGEGGSPETFELTRGTGDAWTGDFPAEATGSVLFLVRAVDNVGNSAEARCGTQLCSLALGNRPPTDLALTITSGGQAVAAGGTVRGEVSIGFLGTDPEGDQVQFTVKLRRTGAADKVLVADATQSPVPWDTAAEDDGTWTVVLEAKDQGGRTATVTQEVVVRNVGVSLVTPLPTSVNAGGSLLFEYRVTHPSKDVASVVAVLRVGTQTERVPLFDDGTHGDRTANDGTFSAQYTPRLRGQHTVDLQVTYAGDPTPATISNVGTFQAQGLAETVASVTFYAVIVLGIIAAALGVFGLRRWG